MIICCTQRAAREFSFGPGQLKQTVSDIQDQSNTWYAHVFYIGRLKCLVLTHGTTLFSAVKEGYKRVNLACPEELVKNMIAEALYLVGASPEAIKKGSDEIRVITYAKAKATDRRVLGSMNDMIKIYKYERDPRSLIYKDYPTSLCHMNRAPMTMLKYGYPAEVFIHGLGFTDYKVQV